MNKSNRSKAKCMAVSFRAMAPQPLADALATSYHVATFYSCVPKVLIICRKMAVTLLWLQNLLFGNM